MAKYYFCDIFHNSDELCYDLPSILQEAKEQGLKEIEIIEAKADIGSPYFFCKHFQFVGEVGQSCGKQCEAYEPRNGKNGRCVFSSHCYSRTDKTIKIKLTNKTKTQ